MGMDFIYAICRKPVDEQGAVMRPSPALARAITNRLYQALKDSEPENLIAMEYDAEMRQEEIGEEWRSSLIEHVHRNFIKPVFGFNQQSRYMSEGNLSGVEFFISGDISYGDLPEECDYIWLLNGYASLEVPFSAGEIESAEKSLAEAWAIEQEQEED